MRSDSIAAAPDTQRHEAAQLGMWLFLASEVMMFGSLLLIAWFYRVQHPQGVGEAVAELHYLLAAGNTAVLFTSSLCMSCALVSPRRRRWLLAALLLGVAFLACKGWEYHLEYVEGLLPGFGLTSPLHEPSARLFINLYFITTCLHGVHLLVAVGLVSHLVFVLPSSGTLTAPQRTRLQLVTLYWHLVDAIWVVVFPTLYLVGR